MPAPLPSRAVVSIENEARKARKPVTWSLSSTRRLLNNQVTHFLAPPASFSMVTTLYHYMVYTMPPYCWGPNHFLSLVYHFGNTTSTHAVNPHMPHTCQRMTMPSHHDPHTHATDMEALFSGFHVSGALAQCPPTRCHQPHRSGGTGSVKTRERARTTSVVLALPAPQSLWGGVERTEGVLTPPLPRHFATQMQKPCQHRQAALRRFLVTLPAIGRIFAPDLNRAHPQGV